jgi:AsmA protein
MKSPLLRVAGAGDINVGEDSINYLVKASLVNTLKGQDGASDLKGITVPVRATGPLAAPSFSLDFNAMLTDTVKQQAEDKIKGKLEGLLGGNKAATPAPGSASAAPGAAAPKSNATKDAIKGLFGR